MNGDDGPAAYQQENNEQLDYSMVDTSQESQQTFQRKFEGQVNGLANAVAVGAQPATDTSNGVEEMDWAETSIIAREEWQQLQQLRDDGGCIASNHYVRNGEAIEECHSIEEEALVADLNVERPVQSPYPRGLGAPIYWSRSPTQESGCHRPQRMQSAAPAVSRPDEDQGLVQCHQMCNSVLVNAVSSMGPTLQAIQHTCNREEFRLWKQKLDGSDAQKATRNKRNSGETFFIEILTQIAQLRQVDEDGVAPAIFSRAIYSDSFEYKVGIRLHPNGVDEEEGRYVALFVHMMMGEYDNASEVRWPFTQRITVSILDQSDAKRHISHIIQPKPHLAAFQKPTEAFTPTGFGFIKFAPIEEAFSSPYVENDKMFIKIQFST
ncbi:TNF receptor-associated factor 6-A-like [Stylophora pistillata]|uniref:TNF receptor-associated factor 6-A-like n=1 Tax=Stylophora pistillata TaxID=50429 RepID=UPI000C03D7A6|nr:TNF receptor-associated factor 6-A-like [Stylophora pistillata]